MPAHLKYPKVEGESLRARKARIKRIRFATDPAFKKRCEDAQKRCHKNQRLNNPELFRARNKRNWEREKLRPNFQEYRKRSQLKCKYRLTLEEYNAMLVAQQGNCAICGQPMQRPVVDHNHDTDKVRQLLCSPCNSAIGLLQENPVVLRRAADYIERHQQCESQPN